MSKQRKSQHTFVHTITVSGVVYILRFERLAPKRYAATSLTGELVPFEIEQTPNGWLITAALPDKEKFEALLKEKMDEEVG